MSRLIGLFIYLFWDNKRFFVAEDRSSKAADLFELLTAPSHLGQAAGCVRGFLSCVKLDQANSEGNVENTSQSHASKEDRVLLSESTLVKWCMWYISRMCYQAYLCSLFFLGSSSKTLARSACIISVYFPIFCIIVYSFWLFF